MQGKNRLLFLTYYPSIYFLSLAHKIIISFMKSYEAHYELSHQRIDDSEERKLREREKARKEQNMLLLEHRCSTIYLHAHITPSHLIFYHKQTNFVNFTGSCLRRTFNQKISGHGIKTMPFLQPLQREENNCSIGTLTTLSLKITCPTKQLTHFAFTQKRISKTQFGYSND